MTVNSSKERLDGSAADKSNEIEFQHDGGTLAIKSSAIHNHIKNNVEHNLISFGLNFSILKVAMDCNPAKLQGEANVFKWTGEVNGRRIGHEFYYQKQLHEEGYFRQSKIISKQKTAYVKNTVLERSYSENQGTRISFTVPPTLDVAIIDASSPTLKPQVKPKDANQPGVLNPENANQPGVLNPENANQPRHGTSSSPKTYLDEVLEGRMAKRIKSEDISTLEESNYIRITEADLTNGELKFLDSIPEWNKDIVDRDRFTFILEKMASPTFPGVDNKPFGGFKGGGIGIQQAKEIGATCRLQVSHGANQTIVVASQSLRTIRFNPISTIDHGKNNEVFLGGRYSHTRGVSSNLFEGSFVQHHRKPKEMDSDPVRAAKEPDHGVAKFRFEDDVSFAFVKTSEQDKRVENLWALKLTEGGVLLGNVPDAGDETMKKSKERNEWGLNGIGLCIENNLACLHFVDKKDQKETFFVAQESASISSKDGVFIEAEKDVRIRVGGNDQVLISRDGTTIGDLNVRRL